jgi:hypothetical protein
MRRMRSLCCARAASGHAAAAPPSSVMNWRRLMSSMGSSSEPAVPAYSRPRMHRKGSQLLGLDLNRSERAGTRSGCASGRRHAYCHKCLAPEVLEPVRRQLGVAHRVLDVFMAEPRLQRPRVVAGIGPTRSRSRASTCEGGLGTAFWPALRSGRIAHGRPWVSSARPARS